MAKKSVQLYITVDAEDADEEYRDELARGLMKELEDVNVIEAVGPVHAGTLPEGAKGTPVDFGTILSSIPAVATIVPVISALGSWLVRGKGRKVTLQIGVNKLEFSGMSKKEQQELIEWYKAQSAYNWTG